MLGVGVIGEWWAPAAADAATVVMLAAVRDNTLYESEAGALSNGAGDYLFAGRTNHAPNSLENPSDRRGLFRRALLAFDVAASVPAGAIVTSAELRLYVSNVSLLNDAGVLDVPVAVHRAFAGWGEGASDAVQQEGIGALAEPGDATWIHAVVGGTLWSAPGGDFAAEPSATTTVGDKFRTYAWSGPGLVADVQGWVDDPASEFGWVVVGDESAPLTAKRFNSRENPDVATRPVLTLTYDVIPEPGAGVLLLLAGILAGLTSSRRAAPTSRGSRRTTRPSA